MGHGEALAYERRFPVLALDEVCIAFCILENVASLGGPVATIGDDFLSGSRIELTCCGGQFSGEVSHPQRYRVSKKVGTGTVPAMVAVVAVLWRTLVQKTAIGSLREVEIPRAEFLHPRSGRVRAAVCNAGHGPEHVEETAGVSCIALGAVGGQAHARKELGALGLTSEVKKNGGHSALVRFGSMELSNSLP